MSAENSENTSVGCLTGLNRLQSDDHEEVLDIIDQLRSEGISRYVDLPQLIVCGDQSSGKSSVLEAISGLDFPRKENFCTRFATELILRRSSQTAIKVSINPDLDRPEKEILRLRNFKPPTSSLDHFAEIVKSAENIMGVGEDDLPFSKDTLRIEVSGPAQPHLTLVDLPGLYHAPDESQTMQGIAFVEQLVRSYMKNTRSVILAVMSAQNEIALQKVTAFTREIDPTGARTLGIITKPDTLNLSSEREKSFYLLAQNKRVEFRLGWHVLKNRAFEERECSLAERHSLEAEFLSQGIWASLPPSRVGIHSLLPRLSSVLKDHILSQMPGFVIDTHLAFRDARSGLEKLGDSRRTLSEQRRYLLRGSERFSTIMNNSLHGVYLDPFFGDALDDEGYEKRLRAVMQDRLSGFSEAMEDRGEQTKVVDDAADLDHGRRCVYRTDYIEEVRQRMRRSRGRELPGSFNPLIVAELFFQQTRPWEGIVTQYSDDILKDVRNATISTLQEVLDKDSADRVLKHVVNNRLLKLEESLRTKTAELLKPQQTGHPITYNPQFVENVQKTHGQHLRESITKKLKAFFGVSYPQNPHAHYELVFCMNELINSVTTQTETDMERFACCQAIDYMLAYYQIAMRQFVDDFSNLAVEKCLLEPLSNIFSPRTVEKLTNEVVEDIAREDEITERERKRLMQKLTILEKSLTRLQRLARHTLTVPRTTHKKDDEGNHEETLVTSNENSKQTDTDEDHNSTPIMVTREEGFSENEVVEEILPTGQDEIDSWPAPTSTPVKKKKRTKHRMASAWEFE